jgi:hypothetical protein
MEDIWEQKGIFEKDREKLLEEGEWVQDYPTNSTSLSDFIIDIDVSVYSV